MNCAAYWVNRSLPAFASGLTITVTLGALFGASSSIAFTQSQQVPPVTAPTPLISPTNSAAPTTEQWLQGLPAKQREAIDKMQQPRPMVPLAHTAESEQFKKAIELNRAAKVLRYKGEVDRALTMYREAAKTHSWRGSHEGIADCLADKGKYGEALGEYRLAIGDSQLPNSGIAFNTAIALSKLGRNEDAIIMYRIGLRLPVPPQYLTDALRENPLGNSYAKERNSNPFNDAAVFDIAFDPQAFDGTLFEAVARTAIGEDLGRYGLEEMAMIEYNKALRLEPEFAPALLHCGILYLLQRKSKESTSDLERAVDLGSQATRDAAQHWLDHTHVTVGGTAPTPSKTQQP